MERLSMAPKSRIKSTRALFLLSALMAVLLAGASPAVAHAENRQEVHVNLSNVSGDTYHCNDPNKVYYLSGTTTSANVVVDKNKGSKKSPIKIVLEGCTIDQDNSRHQQPAIDLKHGSWAEISVAENTVNMVRGFKGEGGAVWNDQGHAGINVDYAAHLSLTVNGSGNADGTPELTCYGGMNSAGIGGSDDKSGEIEIAMNGGNLASYGGTKAAGIGGGNDSDDNKYIKITGHGTITAEGGENGCGIGSGEDAKGDDIDIIGDDDKSLEPNGRTLTVHAKGKGDNAAIGYGQDDGSYITLVNCIVSATVRERSSGAIIGTGRYTHASGDKNLVVYINNCDISAFGSTSGAGIGAGNGGSVKSIEIWNSTYRGTNIGSGDVPGTTNEAGRVDSITIGNSDVEADATWKASPTDDISSPRAGIGTGEWASCGSIHIMSSRVKATGRNGGAGIGTGGVPSGQTSLTKLNGSAMGYIGITDSEVEATSGGGGAGIGGGQAGRVDSVNITRSKVTATAGKTSSGTRGGAGIGGGNRDGGNEIAIDASEVTATGYSGAAGIGTAGTDGSIFANIDGRIHMDLIKITNGSKVTATGGENAAGVGSGWGAYLGNKVGQGIIIQNSAVTATGGRHGAGIGGGADGPDMNTGDGDLNRFLASGTCQIEAQGGEGAAGIGGGFDGFAENLTFDLATDVTNDADGNLVAGSYVKAQGGAGAAGIGAGAVSGNSGNDVDGIVINGGYIEATGGGDYLRSENGHKTSHGTAAGIGGGEAGGSLHNLTVNGGYIKASTTHGTNTGYSARAIGHGGWNFSSADHAIEHDTNIRINGGTLDVDSWTNECDIVVEGGTFVRPVEASGHTVKNSDGSKLYRTTMYLEQFPPYRNTEGGVKVTSDTSYGTKDLITDGEGGLFLMLPASDEMKQTATYGPKGYVGTTSDDDKGWLKMSGTIQLTCTEEQLVRGHPFTIIAEDSGWAGSTVEWEFANGKDMFEVVDQQDTCPGAHITLRAVKMGTYTVKAHVNNASAGDNYFSRLYWNSEGSYTHSINTFDTKIHFLNNPSKVYDGEPIDDVEVQYGGTAKPRIDYQDKNGKWSSTKPYQVGTYTVRARVSESWPYPAAEATMEVTVSKRPIVLSADSIQKNGKGVNGFTVHINNLVTSEGSLDVVAHEDGKPDQTRTYNANSFTEKDGGRSLFVDVDDFNLTYKTVFDVSFSNTYNYTETDPVQVTYNLPDNDEEPVPEPKATRTLTAQYESGRYGEDTNLAIKLTTDHPVDKDALSIQMVQDVAPGDVPDAASVAPTLDLSSIGDVTFTEDKWDPGSYIAWVRPKVLNAGTMTISFAIAESDDVEGARAQLDAKVLQNSFHLRTTVNGKTDEVARYGETDDLTYGYDKTNAQVYLKWGDTIEDVLSLGKDTSGNKAPGYNASVSIDELPSAAAAGTYQIGVTKQGADATVGNTTYPNLFYSRNYFMSYSQAKVTVEKAQLTLHVDDATGTYGKEPAYSFVCSGLAPWDTASAVLDADAKAALADGKRYVDLSAGSYPDAITVTGATLADGMDANYLSDVRIENGDLTITKAAYEGTLTLRSKTYDGGPLTANVEVIDTATGKVVEDADTVQVTYAKRSGSGYVDLGSEAPVDAGSYRATLTVAGDANHEGLKITKRATIDKASAPKVVVDDVTGIYGGKEPAYRYEVEGIVDTDRAEDVVSATAALDTDAAGGAYADLQPGTYAGVITAKDVKLISPNYEDDVTVANGTLTVSVKEVQLKPSVSVDSKVYDGTPVATTTDVEGYAAGDELEGTVTYYDLGDEEPQALGSAPRNAGSYRVAFTVPDSTSADGTVRYRGATATADFEIAQAPAPVIAVDDATVTYGEAEPSYSYEVSGLASRDTARDVLAEDTVAALGQGLDYGALGAGTYKDAITVAAPELSEAGAVNYRSDITVKNGTLTIEPAPLELKLDVASKVYDGAAAAATWSVVNSLTGEDMSDTGTLAFYEVTEDGLVELDGAPADAGSYVAELSADVSANYATAPVTVSFSIYRALPHPETPTLADLELRDGLTLADEEIPADAKGAWSWADGSRELTEAGTVSALAVYTPQDTRNYLPTVRMLSFEVVDRSTPEPDPDPEPEPDPEPDPEPKPDKAEIEVSASADSKVYDGKPVDVMTKAVNASTSETLPDEGTLTYYEVADDGTAVKLDAAPVDAGHYAVIYQVEETDEHQGGSATALFDIYRAVPAPEVSPLPDLQLKDGLKLSDQELSPDDAGTWAWVAPETELTAAGTYEFLARYTPNDTRNYVTVYRWRTFNVIEAAEPDPDPMPDPKPDPNPDPDPTPDPEPTPDPDPNPDPTPDPDPNPSPAPSDQDGNANGDNDTTTSTTAVTTIITKVKLAATGDNAFIIAGGIALAGVAVIAVATVLIRRRK